VIFVSDNGYHVGEKDHFEKSTLWDASARIPFAVRLPAAKNAGTVSKATVGLIDLFPTLIDYCDLPAPRQGTEGRSLRPVLENPGAPWTRPAITVYEDNVFSAADDRFRYIRYADGTEELYDHADDPHEFKNVAAEPAHSAVKARLRAAMPAAWAKSLGGREG
jgi:arylsulfatase A-like enzyme